MTMLPCKHNLVYNSPKKKQPTQNWDHTIEVLWSWTCLKLNHFVKSDLVQIKSKSEGPKICSLATYMNPFTNIYEIKSTTHSFRTCWSYRAGHNSGGHFILKERIKMNNYPTY